MSRFVSFCRHVALLVARLGLGGILLLHGAHRWQAGMASQAEYLAQFSTPYARYAAYGATTFEIVGGLFLLLGALTPLVGLGVLVQQVLTIVWTSYYKGPDLVNADGSYRGGFEYSVALGVLGLLFLVFGGGIVSLDRVFTRTKPTEADEAEGAKDEAGAVDPAAAGPSTREENTFFPARTGR